MKPAFWLILILSLGLNFFLVTKIFQIRKNNSLEPKLGEAKVVRVIDGDTFELEDKTKVRLWGINAPEYPEGCLSEQAKKRLEQLTLKPIAIEFMGQDNFGRVLGWVTVDRIPINLLMIGEGLAEYEGKEDADDQFLQELERSEETAIESKIGIWGESCGPKNKSCTVKANYRQASNSKIYHTSDCYNYSKVIIRPARGDRWFCSETEAQKAGYQKSKDCPGMK